MLKKIKDSYVFMLLCFPYTLYKYLKVETKYKDESYILLESINNDFYKVIDKMNLIPFSEDIGFINGKYKSKLWMLPIFRGIGLSTKLELHEELNEENAKKALKTFMVDMIQKHIVNNDMLGVVTLYVDKTDTNVYNVELKPCEHNVWLYMRSTLHKSFVVMLFEIFLPIVFFMWQ